MSTVTEIKEATAKLTFEERAELARWFHGWKDDAWDRQIAKDAAAGRLDKLIAAVDKDMEAGWLRDMS